MVPVYLNFPNIFAFQLHISCRKYNFLDAFYLKLLLQAVKFKKNVLKYTVIKNTIACNEIYNNKLLLFGLFVYLYYFYLEEFLKISIVFAMIFHCI